MIRYIRGYYAMTFDGGIIVESQSGIGFSVFLPAGSPLYRYGEGEEIKVFTSMVVKEDDITLYGFHNRESLELFELLKTVNGVGAKAALSLLSALSAEDLKRAIAFEDVKEISRANGIGKKTAERLILELRDKVGAFAHGSADFDAGSDAIATDDEQDSRSEAVRALIALGYSKAEACSAIAHVTEEALSCEEYIKKALKHLF